MNSANEAASLSYPSSPLHGKRMALICVALAFVVFTMSYVSVSMNRLLGRMHDRLGSIEGRAGARDSAMELRSSLTTACVWLQSLTAVMLLLLGCLLWHLAQERTTIDVAAGHAQWTVNGLFGQIDVRLPLVPNMSVERVRRRATASCPPDHAVWLTAGEEGALLVQRTFAATCADNTTRELAQAVGAAVEGNSDGTPSDQRERVTRGFLQGMSFYAETDRVQATFVRPGFAFFGMAAGGAILAMGSGLAMLSFAAATLPLSGASSWAVFSAVGWTLFWLLFIIGGFVALTLICDRALRVVSVVATAEAVTVEHVSILRWSCQIPRHQLKLKLVAPRFKFTASEKVLELRGHRGRTCCFIGHGASVAELVWLKKQIEGLAGSRR